MIRFRDREEAGRKLAVELVAYAVDDPIVLALPRGGVPVGFEVARALSAPLDVWVVRKLGLPWHQEFGVGAVAEGGFVYLAPGVPQHVGLSQEDLAELIEIKGLEVQERVRKFRGGRPLPVLRGRTVILVDDGIATGGTVRAAISSIRAQHPEKIILAVPVAAPSTISALDSEVEGVVCLSTPRDLHAIGLWYHDFTQVDDDEVVALLESARQAHESSEHVVA